MGTYLCNISLCGTVDCIVYHLSVQFFVLMLVLRVLCNAQLNILGIAACLVSSVQSSHPTLGAMAQCPDPGCTPWARCWVQNYRTLTSCLSPGQIRELMRRKSPVSEC